MTKERQNPPGGPSRPLATIQDVRELAAHVARELEKAGDLGDPTRAKALLYATTVLHALIKDVDIEGLAKEIAAVKQAMGLRVA